MLQQYCIRNKNEGSHSLNTENCIILQPLQLGKEDTYLFKNPGEIQPLCFI